MDGTNTAVLLPLLLEGRGSTGAVLRLTICYNNAPGFFLYRFTIASALI